MEDVPDALPAELAGRALATHQAIVVGSRTGVVEWANPAWTRITGFPLDETLDKPITHFLEQAEIDVELVDFVGQQFLDGKRCTVELPYETAGGRSLWIHLEVEPIRNDRGEITAFLAVATDASERRASDLEDHRHRETPVTRPESRPEAAPVGLSSPQTGVALPELVERASRRAARGSGSLQLDLAFDRDLPAIACSARLLEALVEGLVAGAAAALENEWGTVTILTGRIERGRGHVSRTYPFTARPRVLAHAPALFLEVHDTGRSLDPEALGRIRGGGICAGGGREAALVEAGRLARDLGADLHVDSAPGCGTQVLVLFGLPQAAATSADSPAHGPAPCGPGRTL